jgi:hypothetical protein
LLENCAILLTADVVLIVAGCWIFSQRDIKA